VEGFRWAVAGVPPLRPLTQADLAGGRVYVDAAQLGVLDADQEPLGIGSCE
jgi:hypothetical protein